MYGLVKVHKPNYPIRPIVSSINSPCQHLARFLLPILNPLVGTTSTFILNSQHFIEQIKNLDINEKKIMGSFDVVNLFTTTPVDKTLSIVKAKLQEDVTLPDRTNLPIETIMEMITVCVKNTYFQYGQEFYKQEKGMAIGSPLSPVLCNLFLEDLEERAISSFRSKPEVFVRYMDDIFFVWPHGECNIS
jgi:hypothetical protein